MESHYIKIYTGSFVIVQLLVDRLQDVGISPIIKDESESGRLAGFGASIQFQQEVFVHENELEKATPIVQGIVSEMQT
jgi:hypothetical protein